MPLGAQLFLPAVDVDEPPLGGQEEGVGGPEAGGGRGQEVVYGGGEGGEDDLHVSQLGTGCDRGGRGGVATSLRTVCTSTWS